MLYFKIMQDIHLLRTPFERITQELLHFKTPLRISCDSFHASKKPDVGFQISLRPTPSAFFYLDIHCGRCAGEHFNTVLGNQNGIFDVVGLASGAVERRLDAHDHTRLKGSRLLGADEGILLAARIQRDRMAVARGKIAPENACIYKAFPGRFWGGRYVFPSTPVFTEMLSTSKRRSFETFCPEVPAERRNYA